MDIHVTYETLFDLLRKERSLEELQSLDRLFWKHVVEYLQEREAFYAKTSAIEQEKTRIQLNNMKRIIKEIYEHRERKIVNLAVNVVRSDNTQFIDTKNMLAEEKILFDETANMLRRYKREILQQVFNKELPTISPSAYIIEEKEEEPRQETSSEEEVIHNPVEAQVDDENMTVSFTTSVPKFLGKQKEIYGPYEAGDTAKLPTMIAQILLRKGKAEEI